MQYFRMIHDEVLSFCAKRAVSKGFEIDFLKNNNSDQCKAILAIYEQASCIMEEIEDIAERDEQLSKLHKELLEIA